MKPSTIAAVLAYVASITAANLLVAEFGPAISVLNAFLLIGLDLSLRDYLHDLWQTRRAVKLGAMIVAAGAISFALNPASGRIAVASSVAFVAAAFVDWTVYRVLARREWVVRANGSNLAGAAVDSIAFPALAFGMPLLWPIVLGQFVAKIAGGAIWAQVIAVVRERRAPSHG